MLNLKVNGRIFKNIGQGFYNVFFHPYDTIVNLGHLIGEGVVLGADVIDATKYHALKMKYRPEAKTRNQKRIDSLKNLWEADNLTKVEIAGTAAGSFMFAGGGFNLARNASLGNQLLNAGNKSKTFLKLYDVQNNKSLGANPFHGKDFVRNNFNISQKHSSAKSTHSNLAQNANSQIALNKKLSALQDAQKKAVKIKNFKDGRIRYYEAERPSKSLGPTRGSSHVTEYNLKTGQIRSWSECYEHQGNINRINPKMIDGKQIKGQHYPPTKKELKNFSKKLGGPK